MKKQNYIFSGILSYNNDAEYELRFRDIHTNISAILENILNSNKKYIEIKVMNGYKLIFEEQGNLMKYKSYETGVVDYHINGNCLGDVLFNCTDELLDIEIYAEILLDRQGDRDYGREQITSCAK